MVGERSVGTTVRQADTENIKRRRFKRWIACIGLGGKARWILRGRGAQIVHDGVVAVITDGSHCSTRILICRKPPIILEDAYCRRVVCLHGAVRLPGHPQHERQDQRHQADDQSGPHGAAAQAIVIAQYAHPNSLS